MQSISSILKITLTLAVILVSFFINAYGAEHGMKLKISDRVCEVNVTDNSASRALLKRLPLIIEMHELNGNEKHGELDAALPTAAISPDTIQKGDVMLWGDTTLVLFYKTFKTHYSYTKIGRLSDPSCLDSIVNKNTVSVEVLPYESIYAEFKNPIS